MNNGHQFTEPDPQHQPFGLTEADQGTRDGSAAASEDTAHQSTISDSADSCVDLLTRAAQALDGAPEPDSTAVREALRAARQVTGAAGAVSGSTPGWHFALLELTAAESELRDGLPALPPAQSVAEPRDEGRARAGTIELVHRLAELYRAAAFNAAAPGFRRLVWAAVAGNLDLAAGHLEAAS
jgi:hypothetical protein